MVLSSNLNLFLLGLALGAGVAVLGGLTEYFLHLRRDREPFTGVPSCLLYTIGGLVLAGIIAIVASLILTGGIFPAIYMGIGVLAGFYAGFIIMVSVWLVLERRRNPEQTPPSETSSPSEQSATSETLSR